MQQLRRSLFCGLLVFLSLGAAVNLHAKNRKVYPTMTRAAIQSVIDLAKNGDEIVFYAGTYDFSDTPFSNPPWGSGGALIVTNKSLTFTAKTGTILMGAASTLDPTSGYGTSGIIAFNVMNSASKDISFYNFTFQKFVIAINSGIVISNDPDPAIGYVMAPSCRDFSVQNCTFQEIDRNAISTGGVQRNILILNNEITWSLRMGMYIDWYWVGDHLGSQPKLGKITIANNDVHARTECVFINRGYKMSIKSNTFDADGSDTMSTGLGIYGGAHAAGITKNNFTNLTYGLDLNGEKKVVGTSVYSYPMTLCNITYNTVIAEGGIFLGNDPCHDNTVAYNTIALGGPDAWGISTIGGYNDTITNNNISGYGIVAIDVEGYDDTSSGGFMAQAHNEYFAANNVKKFTATEVGVDYYMNPLTHDNKAIGICYANAIYNANYYDEGVNNKFKCIYPVGTLAYLNGFQLSKRSRSDRKPLTN